MGASANDAFERGGGASRQALAEGLGAAIARAGCILITGRDDGIAGLSQPEHFASNGGFCAWESRRRRIVMSMSGATVCPDDGADVII
mgnify:CR=1 FL=1